MNKLAYYVAIAESFEDIKSTFSPFVGQKFVVDYPKKIYVLFVVIIIGNGINEPHFDFKVSYGN